MTGALNTTLKKTTTNLQGGNMNSAKVFGRIFGLSATFATLMVIAFYGLGKTSHLVHAHAQDDENVTTGCTLATIKGNYGLLSSLGATPEGFDATIGILQLDGKGKADFAGSGSNEKEVVPITGSGTYTLHSNCAGTVTLEQKLGTTTGTFKYGIVVVSGGNQIDVMIETPPFVATFVANKIS
jgi:hypothetical protein